METYFFEYTDTFGGEANYSWVRKGEVKASSMKQAIRKAKKELGLNGARFRYDKGQTSSEFCALYPSGSCTVLFVF